jgi:hypothetical protein
MAKRSSKSDLQTTESQDTSENNVMSSELTATSDLISSKNMSRLHLFATILTYAAPSANQHGKGDENDNPLQTRFDINIAS